MRFAKSAKIALLGFGIVVGVWGGATAYAENSDDLSGRLGKIESQIAAIEKQQTQILNQQQEILKKLDVLKVWARRS